MAASCRLFTDFESRSTLELTDVGLDNYAGHATTDVWCMSYAFDDEPVDLWTPIEPLPPRVVDHVYNGGEFVAHNVAFELEIWNRILKPRYGAPSLLPAVCTCTMAMAYAMALPGNLESAAAAVGLDELKDAAGRRLMLQMARPRTLNPLTWWDDADKLARLYAYCRQDTVVERLLYKRLLPLSPYEKKVWAMDYAINKRGIRIDTKAVEAAIAVADSEKLRCDAEIQAVTQHAVSSITEVASLTKWVRAQGVDTDGLAKADVLALLENDVLPEPVRRALELRQEAGRSSTAKFRKMLTAVSADGRLRNTLQYHGAGTGRWAGRLVQIHNLPRPTIHDDDVVEAAFQIIDTAKSGTDAARDLETLIGSPYEVLVNMIRGMFVPNSGMRFVAGDYANIEGRGLAWLAGEEWKLQAFRDFDTILGRDEKGKPIRKGPDIYCLAYAKTFGVSIDSVTDDQRQVGKVEELALGYGGGVGAFQTMARGYDVKVSDVQADVIKNYWREAHPATVAYWYALERAATNAARNPGQKFPVGPKGRQVTFLKKGSFLWCKLPSDRNLCYPYPEMRMVTTPWGEEKDSLTYKTVPSQTTKLVPDPNNVKRWARVSTHGGKLAENITQAIARDLLADAMLRLDAARLPIVLHVHDEAVVEVFDSFNAKLQIAEVERIMSESPPWAAGLPVVTKAWAGKRYKKG